MKHIVLAFTYAIFLVAAQSHAWTGIVDFENGSTGASAFDFYKDTTYSKDFVHSGGQSGKSYFPGGSIGKYTGGNYTFPQTLSEGDELWFRMYVYFPNNFDFTTNPRTKLMRTKNGGGHTGLTWRSSGTVNANNEIDVSKFIANNPNYKSLFTLEKGVWQAVEMYLKLSSKPGSGVYRVWHKGKLVFDDRKTQTLVAGYNVPGGFFGSYWNGGSPKPQSMYVDDIVWTSDTPSNRDANGHPFIGLGKGNPSTSAPEPKPASPPVAPKVSLNN